MIHVSRFTFGSRPPLRKGTLSLADNLRRADHLDITDVMVVEKEEAPGDN